MTDKIDKGEETLETSTSEEELKTQTSVDEEKTSQPFEEKEKLSKPSEEKEEPLVRKPKQEQTLEEKRLGYKIRKLEEKIQRIEEQGFDNYPESYSEESKVGSLRTEFTQKFAELEDKMETEKEFRELLEQNPKYKDYSSKIIKYANHPAYRQIPIKFIADGIVGQAIAEDNYKKEVKANIEASETKSGGSSYRKSSSKPSIWDMSKEEFEAYQNEVKKKGRD